LARAWQIPALILKDIKAQGKENDFQIGKGSQFIYLRQQAYQMVKKS
jgi:hypothetical protein